MTLNWFESIMVDSIPITSLGSAITNEAENLGVCHISGKSDTGF